jgi:hypothetical protein
MKRVRSSVGSFNIGLPLGFGVTALLIIIFTKGRVSYQRSARNANIRRPMIEKVNANKVKEENL